MNPKTLKAISYLGVILVMVMSLAYAYKSWQSGDTKWNFLILGCGIAILLSVNLLVKKKRD